MSEKKLNTDEIAEDMSLSSQLSRRRRNRRTPDAEQMGNDGREEMDNAIDEDDGRMTSGGKETAAAAPGGRRMRITMFGISGSGKTSFLSGVYQTMMMDSFHGLSLVPSTDVDEAFQQIGQISDIALINRKGFEFATGTLETTIFPLSLVNDGEVVCNFDFTDYAGGDVIKILSASGDIGSGAETLKQQLLQSDAILVFADAVELCRGRNLAEWQRETGATKLNPLFNLVARAMNGRPMTVLLVLTKTDDERIPEQLKANHFARLTERAMQTFNMICQLAQRHVQDGWSFGVIPISAVGEGNSAVKESRTGEGDLVYKGVVKDGCVPEPYNIEITLVYTIACILSQWKREDDAEKEALTERLIEEGRGNTLLGNLFSGWKKMPRPEEKVAGLLTEIEEKDRAIGRLSRNINDLISRTGVRDQVQRHRDHLANGREDGA